MTNYSTSLESSSKYLRSRIRSHIFISRWIYENWIRIFFYSVPIVLVGNKTDLYVDRMVSTDQGKRLASSWNAAFLETSAKQNEVYLQITFSTYAAEFLLNAFSNSLLQIFFTHYWRRSRRPMGMYKKSRIALFVELPKWRWQKCKCVKLGKKKPLALYSDTFTIPSR